MFRLLVRLDAPSSGISGHNEGSLHEVWQCGQTLFLFPHSLIYTHIESQTKTKERLSGWVRATLLQRLTRINTHPAEARRERWSPLPGYMEGQSVLSYCTVQPLSTAAPYRVHKAWWMAYHHLPLWWLLNAVTPHQAHARGARRTKTDRQAKAEHNDANKKAMQTKWC